MSDKAKETPTPLGSITTTVINGTFVAGQVLNAGSPVKQVVTVDATLTLNNAGAGGDIPASTFGLAQILSVDGARSSAAIYPAAPDLAGANVILGNISGTSTGTPAGASATIRMLVTGYPPAASTYSG